MSAEADPEQAIRAYLRAIAAPAATADAAEAAELDAAVAAAGDPIDKLHALAARDRARAAGLEDLQRGFVRHARTWALDHDVPRDAFRQLGVDDAVLDAAGFGVDGRGRGARAGVPGRGRGRPTTVDEIKDHVRARSGRFTGLDLAAEVGGSPMTIRKALNELVADGTIERLGPDPDHHELGRAPIVYELRSERAAGR